MLTNYEGAVREWMRLAGLSTPESPTMPDVAEREMRCRLLLEEVMEFIGACGFDVQIGLGGRFSFVPNGEQPDLAAMAHEAADVLVVDFGNFVAMGIPAKPPFLAVHEANMRKFPGGKVLLDERGKVQKPPGWTPADMGAVLARLKEGDVNG